MLIAMNIAPTRWYDEGPFRILQHPLHGNPYWATHWIYRTGRLIGKLLSVPSLADCELLERQAPPIPSYERPKAALRGVAKQRKRA